MALKGDLNNISLFDVLQTLHQNKQDGVLVVHRDGETKKLHISETGVRIFFSRNARPLKLGEIFVRRGRITTQDVEILLLQQKQSYRPMGELLIESGKIRTEEVQTLLLSHAEDEIYDLFTWEEGTFAFYDGQSADDSDAPLSEAVLDPAGLCLEAARRLDETDRLRQTVPDDDMFFIQVEDAEPDRSAAGEDICHAFDALSEPNSLADLRDLVGLSIYAVLGAASQLLEARLIRPLDANELLDTGRRALNHGRAARMLEKAHELEPDNREILEECIASVAYLAEPKRLARHYGALGRLCMADGDTAKAIELLEQALRQDSDNIETLAGLRSAFAEIGDQAKARDISLRIARSHADEGDIPAAIQACTDGLEVSPTSLSLRFHRAQLYVRVEMKADARAELEALIADTESSDLRSHLAQDLLANCFRLLLRIDPDNEEAARGMRNLNNQRESSQRRKRLIVRGSIAAALLAVVGVVGFTLGGASASDLLGRVQDAYRSNNVESVRAGVNELMEQHPDSDEAQRALGFLSELQKRQRATDSARLKREQVVGAELNEAWDEVRTALNERPYLEGLALVPPFLERLNKPQVRFLRSTMQAHFEYEFGAFLDRVLEQFGTERQQLTLGEYQLRKTTQDIASLQDLEAKLGRVRARNWTELIPQIIEMLQKISTARQVGKAKDSIEAFRKMMGDTTASFSSLDGLYFTVRRKRLRLEITTAVAEAREQRLDLLRQCKFKRAYELYDLAFQKADGVTDEEPREHFSALIHWLDSTRIRQDMHAKRDEINAVISTLAEIGRLRKAGKNAAAYRLFRPLVLGYPVIQFEGRYTMPYEITSTPNGGEVYINGKLVGRTPVQVELDIVKRSNVVVKRAGFADASQRLVATDPALTGELRLDLTKHRAWKRTLTGRVEASPVFVRSGKRRLLLVATSNANLVAIDTKDGSAAWSAETRLLDRIIAPPLAAGRYAYLITVSGVLHRIRLTDGAMDKTRLQLPGRVSHAVAWDGKVLYAATENKRLVAVRGLNVVYDKPLSMSPTTRVLLTDGKLVLGTAEGSLLVHDAATGKEIRRIRTRSRSSFLGGAAVYRDLVVAGAEDGALYAFDIKLGEVRWRYVTAGPVTAPPTCGKFIFLPARDGYVHALDAEGKPAIRYELNGPSEHAPTILDGFLYAAGGALVSAFDTDEELPWWEYEFEVADGVPEHVVARFGLVVVITSKSKIVAFAADKR